MKTKREGKEYSYKHFQKVDKIDNRSYTLYERDNFSKKKNNSYPKQLRNQLTTKERCFVKNVPNDVNIVNICLYSVSFDSRKYPSRIAIKWMHVFSREQNSYETWEEKYT